METTITKGMKLPAITMKHAAKFRNTSSDSVLCHFGIDFTECTIEQVLIWAVADRTIAFQRACEKMTAEEIKSAINDKTFHASIIGKKIKSDAEIKAEFMARFNTASPELKQQMIAELQEQMTEDE